MSQMSFQIKEEPGYIFVSLEGAINGEELTQLLDQMQKIVQQVRAKQVEPKCIVDISKLSSVDSSARRVGVSHIDAFDFAKVAFVGKHGSIGAVAEMIVVTTGRSEKMKFFDDLASAETWLQQTN